MQTSLSLKKDIPNTKVTNFSTNKTKKNVINILEHINIFYIEEKINNNKKIDWKELNPVIDKIDENILIFNDIKHLILDNEIHHKIRRALINKLTPNSLIYYNIIDILENEKIEIGIRIALINNIKKGALDFYNSKDFFLNNDIDEKVRSFFIHNFREGSIKIEDLTKILENENYSDEIKYSLLKKVEKKYSNFSEKNLDLKKILFNVESSGSKVFSDLENMMKESPNKNLYNLMEEKVDNVFTQIVPENTIKYSKDIIKYNGKKILNHQRRYASKKEIEKAKQLGILLDKLELSIYNRYRHTVDFPEIIEYITIFLSKLLDEGYFKYADSLRLVPRNKNNFLQENILKRLNVTPYNVSGSINFNIAHNLGAMGINLSHGSNSNPYNSPQVISKSTDNKNNILDIISDLELENKFLEKNSKLKNLSIIKILTNFYNDFKMLEKGGDSLINSDDKYLKIEEKFDKSGKNASVFNISGDKKYIIKINKSPDSLEDLNQELKIGKIFNKNEISTPEYKGVEKVNQDGEIHFGLVMEAIKDGILIKDNIQIGGRGRTIKNTNSEEYIRGKKLLEIEIEKIKKLGLKISPKTEKYGFDFQGIYSKEKDKIYLIDFDEIILEEGTINLS